jgi:hypothetical protein
LAQSQSGQIVCETLSQKKKKKKRAGGVVQGVGTEFKPQHRSKKKKKKKSKLPGLGMEGQHL